jgi:hypothetical protein
LARIEGPVALQIKDKPGRIELEDSESGYEIKLEDVRFGYREDQPILQVRHPLFSFSYQRCSLLSGRCQNMYNELLIYGSPGMSHAGAMVCFYMVEALNKSWLLYVLC